LVNLPIAVSTNEPITHDEGGRTMTDQRPDLSGVTPAVLAYIEALEDENARLSRGKRTTPRVDAPPEPSEPPTSINIIAISASGLAKRTPRHFYSRQRRGGMGVFDLESDDNDPPAFLVAADESAGITLITNQARAFHLPVQRITVTDVRGRGQSITADLGLRTDERLALVMPDSGGAQAILVTERGQVRRYGANLLGDNLRPGTLLYDIKNGGAPAACCWISGQGDLFIVTDNGRGIRFAARQIPVRGALGMRVDPGAVVVGVAGVCADGGVFLLTDEGRGTVRLMSGFSANKAPGSGGKVAMKAAHVIGIAPVAAPGNDGADDDIFIISQLGKIIRFSAADVPPKEGVVQGVNCMSLRADMCVASMASG